MSNLSIQKMLGTVATDTASGAAAPGVRIGRNAPDLRDPAQAFNEVMQRHTAPAPTRDAVREPVRESVREPARQPQSDATRTPERAQDVDRTTQRAPERSTTPNNDSTRPTPAQRSNDDRSTQDSARDAQPSGQAAETGQPNAKDTPAPKVTRNTKDKDATTDDDADPNTRTGDLFADLNLAALGLGGANPVPTSADANATQTTQAAGQDLHALIKQSNSALAAAVPGAPAGGDKVSAPEGRVEISVGSASASAAHLLELAGAKPSDGKTEGKALGHTATPPTALPLTDTPAQANAARGTEALAGLATAAEAHGAQTARTEGNPLSLSAALSGTATHALSPLAGTGNTVYSIAHAQVKTALGTYGFADDFSQRVVMLAGQRVQSAEIAITPADLGPISVTMEMRGQEASLVFGAAQTATRAAIEDALPRLREMFQAQGLHLVDAHVGAQLNQQGQRNGQQAGGSERRSPGFGAEAIGAVGSAATTQAPLNGTASAVTRSASSVRLIDVRV